MTKETAKLISKLTLKADRVRVCIANAGFAAQPSRPSIGQGQQLFDVRRPDEFNLRRRFDASRQGVDPLFAQHQNDEVQAAVAGRRVGRFGDANVATVPPQSRPVRKIRQEPSA